jgi:hypothetical protein
VKELGPTHARTAIAAPRRWLAEHGHRDLHLAAIEPNAEVLPLVRELGFDSVTHYVLLPDWKGPFVQDYREYASCFAPASGAVRRTSRACPTCRPWRPAGTPVAARRRLRRQRPDKYPWWPVVTGEHPQHFHDALQRARTFRSPVGGVDEPLRFVASLNEWSEGHYLEPDLRFGHGWLEAVRDSR